MPIPTAAKVSSLVLGLMLSSICLGCAASSAGQASQGGSGVADQDQEDSVADTDEQEVEFISVNEGGGDLAERLAGSTYSGQAEGPLADGTLELTFDQSGVLLTLGGTVLGEFFGFPEGTDVVFDYQTATVGGTYRAAGVVEQPLDEFLLDSDQSITLRAVVVSLIGDSFFVLTTYSSQLIGQPQDARDIRLEGTLRFETNADLQGGLVFPAYTSFQVPIFSLDRQ